jgi:hypothetical protein
VAHLKQGHGLQEELADRVKGQPERAEAAEQRAGEDVPVAQADDPGDELGQSPRT